MTVDFFTCDMGGGGKEGGEKGKGYRRGGGVERGKEGEGVVSKFTSNVLPVAMQLLGSCYAPVSKFPECFRQVVVEWHYYYCCLCESWEAGPQLSH